MNKKKFQIGVWTALLVVVLIIQPKTEILAKGNTKTEIKQMVYSNGAYGNWDGVSNVAQFKAPDGSYSFAYEKKKYVYVVKTKDGIPTKEIIKLKKKHSLFGDVTCDSEENYYVVTGEINKTEHTDTKTIFISKYDKTGKHIKTVGDNGSSSLASYYDSSFCTKVPFEGGNCDASINGDVLAVNYAREMYSGHQSNSVFAIQIDTMKKITIDSVYSSHSFAQRAIPFKEGFAFASEGDCFTRAFTITTMENMDSECQSFDSFHFWVKKNTYKKWDMGTLNNNFAHMGGLVPLGQNRIAFAGTSVKALNSKAAKQKEQLFIQIIDPSKDTKSKAAYITKGIRSGVSGPNGDEKATDYGVKWLTSASKKVTICNPQIVSNGTDKILVLYEKAVNYESKGVYYQIINANGTVLKKETLFSNKAELNPCRMPVYADGMAYWSSNKKGDTKGNIYIYSLKF